MAPKKTTKTTAAPKPDSEAKVKVEPKNTEKKPSSYQSGDISRLSIMLSMLAVTFIVGLLLGLGLGADEARNHVAKKIDESNLEEMLNEENEPMSSVNSEMEEAMPSIPAPQTEAPTTQISTDPNMNEEMTIEPDGNATESQNEEN